MVSSYYSKQSTEYIRFILNEFYSFRHLAVPIIFLLKTILTWQTKTTPLYLPTESTATKEGNIALETGLSSRLPTWRAANIITSWYYLPASTPTILDGRVDSCTFLTWFTSYHNLGVYSGQCVNVDIAKA